MTLIAAADRPDEVPERSHAIAYELAGGVQSHAVLLVIDAASGRIVQASANADELGAGDAASLAGTPVADFAGLRTVGGAAVPPEQLGAGSARPMLGPVVHDAGGRRWLLRGHQHGGRLLVELEPETTRHDVRSDPEMLVRLVGRLVLLESIDDIGREATAIMREGFGYQRAMLYRFDDEGHGEVVGESRADDTVDAFLGLRFPSTDVPASVRRMYGAAGIRVTVDQAREGVPLVPLRDPDSGEHPDLTYVRSRLNAGVCRTYYLNMGVRSTIVLPIEVDGRAWGLFSLHHDAPRRPSPVHDEFIGACRRVIDAAIERVEHAARRRAESEASRIRREIVGNGAGGEDLRRVLPRQLAGLIDAIGADAIVLRVHDEVHHAGLAVAPGDALAVVRTLGEGSDVRSVASESLAEQHPTLRPVLHGFAGALAVRIGEDWEDHLVCLRREKRIETDWAGDPSAALAWERGRRPDLTPRSSFDRYRLVTAERTRAWTETERMTAETCALLLGLRVLHHRAEASMRAQSTFLANVSHEIRTPMTAILGFADLLCDDDQFRSDPEETRRGVATIRQHAEHLLALVNDILDICKIESGRMTVESIAVDPAALVDEVRGLLAARADEKGIALDVRHATSLPRTIHTDPTRLRQILLNLAGNAIKFTEKGGVLIELAHDPAAELLRVSVVDTGVGLTPEQVETLRRFEPFTQADASTTRRFGGTGLGLSIANAMSRLLGGWIDIESEAGRGSTFRVTLMGAADTGELDKPAPDGASSSRIVGDERPLVGRRLLLVEDGPDNQRLVSFHLKKAGAEVDLAEHGREGLERIARARSAGTPYDLVVMDMQMPVMDGYEAVARLRADGDRTPVLALTAHAMAGDEQRCREAGCDGYETKPIARDRLIAGCADLLPRQQA